MRKITLNILILVSLIALFFPVLTVSAQEGLSYDGQIVYIGTDGNIWIKRGDGSGVLQLTIDAGDGRYYSSPRFSPNGSMLAYCQRGAAGPGGGQLFITRVGEWQPFVLLKDIFCQDGSRSSFDWTLDNTEILYTRDFTHAEADETSNSIWAVNVISGDTSPKIEPPGGSPLVRPETAGDGNWVKLYEIPYIEGLGVLRTLDGNTGSLYNWLGIMPGLFPGDSSWAPDGSQLVIDEVTYAGFPGAGLYVASPNGENLVKIFSQKNKVATNPLWSADGANIAFQLVAYNGRRGQLMLVAPDGSNARGVFQGEGDVLPVVWSPDGNQLLFGAVEDDQHNFYIHDLTSGSTIHFDTVSDWGADWSLIPPATEVVDESSPTTVPEFPFSEGLLVYVAEDYRLVLSNPAEGEGTDLSKPMSVAEFYASPSGQRIIFGSRLVVLDFQSDGSLIVFRYRLPVAPNGEQISWSPDESHFGYKDRDGKVWVADINGNAIEIPGASSLPAWSYDGQWISYCSDGEVLMVFGPDVPPNEVARPVGCQPEWSSSQYLLAYNQLSRGGVGLSDVVIYDPVNDTSKTLVEDSSFLSWSPDGKLMAFSKSEADSVDGTTVYVVEPTSEQQLLVGNLGSEEMENLHWYRQPGGYLFGPFRVALDLSSANRITDLLLDATTGGAGLLSGFGERDLITITCLDPDSGIQDNVVTVNLSGISPERMPGVDGKLSPMGNWITLLVYDRGKLFHQLRLCGSIREITFPGGDKPSLGDFSGDDRWFAQRQSLSDDTEQILLYDLALESTVVLPTVNKAQYSWLKPIDTEGNGSYEIAGQVKTTDDENLSDVVILIDGKEAAVTARSGRFLVEDVAPGSYMIAAERVGVNFSPISILVNVPPGVEGVDFLASLPPPEVAPKIPEPNDSEKVEPEVEVDQEAEAQFNLSLPLLPLNELEILILAGCLVILLAGLTIVPLWFRRRRSRSSFPTTAVPIVKTVKPDVPTQPQRVTQIVETPEPDIPTRPVQVGAIESVPKAKEDIEPVGEDQLNDWLRKGVEEIKRGDFKQGTEKLFKVVQYMPDNASAWMWLGWAAGKQNDLRKAEGCFTEARRLGHPRADEGLAWLNRLR